MKGTFKTTLLLTALTVILVMVGKALGGQGGMILAMGLALVMNGVSYWFSDKIVLRMYGAKEVDEVEHPRLYRIVQRLALKANMPMPRVYVIDSALPNAFATGRNPENAAVAATTGILSMLTDGELSGVMAHELAHVRHRDTLISTVVATLAGAVSMLANMAQWALIFGTGRSSDDEENGGWLGSLAMIILAPVAATLVQLAISRNREYMADEAGAQLHGNPLDLARALAKLELGSAHYSLAGTPGTAATAHLFIVNPLSGGGLFKLFSTHPPTAERVARLEALAGRPMRLVG